MTDYNDEKACYRAAKENGISDRLFAILWAIRTDNPGTAYCPVPYDGREPTTHCSACRVLTVPVMSYGPTAVLCCVCQSILDEHTKRCEHQMMYGCKHEPLCDGWDKGIVSGEELARQLGPIATMKRGTA